MPLPDLLERRLELGEEPDDGHHVLRARAALGDERLRGLEEARPASGGTAARKMHCYAWNWCTDGNWFIRTLQ